MRGEQKRTEPTSSEAADIQARLVRLEDLLEKLATDKAETRIHIEHLHIQQAVLEQMTVKLEQLDIDEVSGSLNIGNNFHTTKGPSPDSTKSSTHKGETLPRKGQPSGKAGQKEQSPPRSRPETSDSIRVTPNGFSYRFDTRSGSSGESKGGVPDGDG